MTEFSKNSVKKAGRILSKEDGHTKEELLWARKICSLWRARHSYVINTFQATLRSKAKKVYKKAVIGQRLKREVSIIRKLKRSGDMSLTRMNDIVGLRTVVYSVNHVRTLVRNYKKSTRLEHDLIDEKDYIQNPKKDGYRCIHLIYKYKNN